MELDITESVVALAENGEGHTLKVFGETFTIPAAMPPMFAIYVVSGDAGVALTALLGPEQLRSLAKHQPNNDQLRAIINAAFTLYGGGDPGKSGGQAGRSTNGGGKSKLTSPGTTTGT